MRISLPGRCAIAMLLTAAAATACGGSGGSGSSGVTVTTTVTETATATGGSTGDTGSAAPCAASDLLPVLKAKMDGSAEKYTIVKVKVVRCQNDYAFVIAVPDRTVCQEGVADCYDSAQVFLSWDGTHWSIFNTGTDIGCTSLPLDDQTLVACKALGYPIVTTTTFKMPSGNIGCALLGTTLRCDIRSGLKPPPAKACAGDWTGAVLAATWQGEAELRERHDLRRLGPGARLRVDLGRGRPLVPVQYVGPSVLEHRRPQLLPEPG